ncbi:MAG: diacylglycerol kinase family protein [Candidatus Tyrphobacter sp.]
MSRFLSSFVHAFDGIVDAARVQPNFVIHLVVSALVLIAVLAFHVVLWQFVVVLVLIALVLALELVNTALEAYVDLVTGEFHSLAKRAKDAAAGAVLAASVCAALAGCAIVADAMAAPRPALPSAAMRAEVVLAALALASVLAVLGRARWGR